MFLIVYEEDPCDMCRLEMKKIGGKSRRLSFSGCYDAANNGLIFPSRLSEARLFLFLFLFFVFVDYK